MRTEVSVLSRKILLTLLLGPVVCSSTWASSIAYQRVRHGRLLAHVVTVNLADPEVKVSVALAAGGAGSSESFRSMMSRTRPNAAITGTFFDTRSLKPTGDIALFGTLVYSGCIGSALTIDRDNKARIVPLKKGRETNWDGCETVLCAGPTLVADGRVAIALKHEGFRRSLMRSSRRTAVGISRSGKLVLVCVNRRASLYDVAKLMIKLNVANAVSLDGGSSTALYFQGGYFACPGRTLTNCLVVYSSTSAYNRARTTLVSANLLAGAVPLR